MDFVERMLGLAPDGGSGLTEVVILVALAGALCLSYNLRGRSKRCSL